jgi:tetratricopeptide (TPR) repeat protein
MVLKRRWRRSGPFALLSRETIKDERDPEITTETVRLHRLVREVAATRQRGKAREGTIRSLLEAMTAVYPGAEEEVFNDPKTWPRARRLDALALALVEEHLTAPEGAEVGTAELLHRLSGYRYKVLGAYGQARGVQERALAIREKVLGPGHPHTAWSLINLAALLRRQGDLAGARPLYERALPIFEKVLGPEHPDTANSLSGLGGLLHEQGDLARARPLCERALAIREKVLGPEHPHTADSLNNLALLLHKEGDPVSARPLHERALAIREKVLGPEHPDTAFSLRWLARCVEFEGDLAERRCCTSVRWQSTKRCWARNILRRRLVSLFLAFCFRPKGILQERGRSTNACW